MKRRSLILFCALVAGVSGAACAHSGGHGHHHGRTRAHVGVYFGPSIGWNGYYPRSYGYPSYAYPSYAYPPYYYPYSPPVVVVPASPPTYIERSQPEEQAPPANDWFYCSKPEGYYPYVRQCPGGWQRVPAQPQQ